MPGIRPGTPPGMLQPPSLTELDRFSPPQQAAQMTEGIQRMQVPGARRTAPSRGVVMRLGQLQELHSQRRVGRVRHTHPGSSSLTAVGLAATQVGLC